MLTLDTAFGPLASAFRFPHATRKNDGVVHQRVFLSALHHDGRKLGKDVAGGENRGKMIVGLEIRAAVRSNVENSHCSHLERNQHQCRGTARRRKLTILGETILS